jgi:hypothetical protein
VVRFISSELLTGLLPMNVQYCHNCSVRIDPEDGDTDGSKFCIKCSANFGEVRPPRSKTRQLSSKRLQPISKTDLRKVKFSSRLNIQAATPAERTRATRLRRRKVHLYVGLIAAGLGVCGALLLFGQVQNSPLRRNAAHESSRVNTR